MAATEVTRESLELLNDEQLRHEMRSREMSTRGRFSRPAAIAKILDYEAGELHDSGNGDPEPAESTEAIKKRAAQKIAEAKKTAKKIRLPSSLPAEVVETAHELQATHDNMLETHELAKANLRAACAAEDIADVEARIARRESDDLRMLAAEKKLIKARTEVEQARSEALGLKNQLKELKQRISKLVTEDHPLFDE